MTDSPEMKAIREYLNWIEKRMLSPEQLANYQAKKLDGPITMNYVYCQVCSMFDQILKKHGVKLDD